MAKMIAVRAVTAEYPPEGYGDIVYDIVVALGLRDEGEMRIRLDAIQASCMSTEDTLLYHASALHQGFSDRLYIDAPEETMSQILWFLAATEHHREAE